MVVSTDEQKTNKPEAVLVVFVCFLSQVLVNVTDGIMGVLLLEFTNHFGESEVLVAAISTCQFTVSCVATILANVLLSVCGLKIMFATGSILTMLGFLASSFVENFPLLFLTYGTVAGIGLSCYYIGAAYAIQVYFTSNRSLAQGITIAGQSLGTFAWAPLTMWLFSQYGWRGAFMIIAGIQFHGVILAVLLYNVNLEPIEKEPIVDSKKKDSSQSDVCTCTLNKDAFSIFFNPILLLYDLSYMFNMFGHFLPFLWLPTLSYQAGASDEAAAMSVSAFSISNFIGKITWGLLGNIRLFSNNRVLLVSSSSFLSAICSMCAIFCNTYLLIMLYGIIQGFFSAGYIALAITACVDLTNRSETGKVTSGMFAVIGIGALMANVLSGWLVNTSKDTSLSLLVCAGLQTIGSMLFLITAVLNHTTKERTYVVNVD